MPPKTQTEAGPLSGGAKGESGGISTVEGDIGEGCCCTAHCIAGFQTRQTDSCKPKAFSGWIAALVVACIER